MSGGVTRGGPVALALVPASPRVVKGNVVEPIKGTFPFRINPGELQSIKHVHHHAGGAPKHQGVPGRDELRAHAWGSHGSGTGVHAPGRTRGGQVALHFSIWTRPRDASRYAHPPARPLADHAARRNAPQTGARRACAPRDVASKWLDGLEQGTSLSLIKGGANKSFFGQFVPECLPRNPSCLESEGICRAVPSARPAPGFFCQLLRASSSSPENVRSPPTAPSGRDEKPFVQKSSHTILQTTTTRALYWSAGANEETKIASCRHKLFRRQCSLKIQ